MRRVILSALVVFSALTTSVSASEKFRPATVAEIMKQIPRLASMRDDGNGFAYASGSDVGYKVSKGEICVRSPNRQVDCVRVESNGETIRMVDSRGEREILH